MIDPLPYPLCSRTIEDVHRAASHGAFKVFDGTTGIAEQVLFPRHPKLYSTPGETAPAYEHSDAEIQVRKVAVHALEVGWADERPTARAFAIQFRSRDSSDRCSSDLP